MRLVMINHIPKLIGDHSKSMTAFHREMLENEQTKISYQSLHRVANKDQYLLPTSTKIETLHKIAVTLGVKVDDLYTAKEVANDYSSNS